MSTPRRLSGISRTAVVAIVAAVVLGLAVALAIPRLLSRDDEAAPPAPPPVAQETPKPPAQQAPDAPAAPEPATETIPTSADGDLALRLHLRVDRVISGAGLPATVRFANTSLAPLDVPDAGEPHPTLALVVLDSAGREVRRVVESGPDPYPHATRTLAPGATMELRALVLSSADEPLAPGQYTVYAEFRPDPAWVRTGLPFWKAPRGPVRSEQESLSVEPKPE